MKSISATFKKYNANAQNKNVGDCVKRALSYAYGLDYNEVSRQLNRIKNEIGSFAFNSFRTWTKFLEDHGARNIGAECKGMSEAEFCEKFPSGVYILLTGTDKSGCSTHMVCIFNGDIIDSWNSSNYIIYDAYLIPASNVETFDVSWEDVEDDLSTFIDSYIESVNAKYSDWFTVWRASGYKLDNHTYRMVFYLQTKNLPQESEYYANQKYSKRIVVKLNPRMNIDENIKVLQPKLKQYVYDWLYPYMKDMRDTQAILKMDVSDINRHIANDTYSRKQLLKLPEWVRPLVLEMWFDPEGKYGSYNKYELRFKALPDDPYKDYRGDQVTIEVDSYKELKDALEAYRQRYARSGYDY